MKKFGWDLALIAVGVLAVGSFAGCSDDDIDGADAGTRVDAAAQGDAGTAADASTAADAGTAVDASTAVTVEFCQEECDENSDCTIGGQDLGYTCNASGRCFKASTAVGCQSAAQCVALFNGWAYPGTPPTPCDADADCTALQVCIQGGYCAYASTSFQCANLGSGWGDVTTKRIDGTTDVVVCGKANTSDAVCENQICRNPCNGNTDCSGTTPVCQTSTGNCVCESSPNSCASASFGGTVCLSSGVCGCSANSECEGAGFDKCFDGVCGCAAVASCTGTNVFGGTVKVCEGF